MSNGFLTTHVLDTAQGIPAAGITITAFRIETGHAKNLPKWSLMMTAAPISLFCRKGHSRLVLMSLSFMLVLIWQNTLPIKASHFIKISQ